MKFSSCFTITAAVATTVSAVGYESLNQQSAKSLPIGKERYRYEANAVNGDTYTIPNTPYPEDIWQYSGSENDQPDGNKPYPAYDAPYSQIKEPSPYAKEPSADNLETYPLSDGPYLDSKASAPSAYGSYPIHDPLSTESKEASSSIEEMQPGYYKPYPPYDGPYPEESDPLFPTNETSPAPPQPYPETKYPLEKGWAGKHQHKYIYTQPTTGGVEYQTKPPVVIIETVTNTLPSDFPIDNFPQQWGGHHYDSNHRYGIKGKKFRKVDIYHKDHDGPYHPHGGYGKKYHKKYDSKGWKHGHKKNKKKSKQGDKHEHKHGHDHGHDDKHGKHKYGGGKHKYGGGKHKHDSDSKDKHHKDVHADSIDKPKLKSSNSLGDFGAASAPSKSNSASALATGSLSSSHSSSVIAAKSAAMAPGSASQSASVSKISAHPAATSVHSGASRIVMKWSTVFFVGLAAYCLL